ncbi:MoxR-like ATPase [Bernardetia litoralis DSM 6794]|uniref:MoxR-like ATPase n=1 Tax=Bernardetia litoralis (strain ATCC 23117 / DSM 6794 / NBRC 15988 / NCIMB 1366 / Fx l1 / Sio-4) TaxID=880071 RepID=I4AJC1_BERLS|nr:AAA family ATPase [Bernardetia litoralis]AFM04056.1 MoxR-like ATPase [Bernardetia litoralis DSM 6794]
MSLYNSDKEAADALSKYYQELKQEIAKVIVGQEQTVELLLTSIFSQGHCLLIGVPGLAKTLLISTLSQVLDLDFKRIQFTPDLMPSDIVGAETLDKDRNIKFVKGAIFSNIILADEINRTPPKTQAALLESMQEYSVTIAGVKHVLPKPFFVLATQNPIEQEGTYPLPEAQLDRFMCSVYLGYPSFEEEVKVVTSTTTNEKPTLNKIISTEQIIEFQQLIRRAPVAQNVIEYAVNLVHKTRPRTERSTADTDNYLEWGAGPRASQYLVLGAKCHALLNGKYSPDIEDVQAIAIAVLRHRIVRNFKAEAENITVEDLIQRLW